MPQNNITENSAKLSPGGKILMSMGARLIFDRDGECILIVESNVRHVAAVCVFDNQLVNDEKTNWKHKVVS